MGDRELLTQLVRSCRVNMYQRAIEQRKLEERRREAYSAFIRTRVQRCLYEMRLNMETSNV